MTKVQDKILTEKYRPQTLDEIVGHDAIVSRMQDYVDDPSMNHIIMAGPAGTGKTTMMTAFAKERFGDGWKRNVLQLNASNERGIDVIRNKVKDFAKQGAADGAEYKIIYMDEVDGLTKDAFSALRRPMEEHGDSTRFFMSCNYLNNVIDPIQSRCAIFRFRRLEDDEVREMLNRIIEGEDITIGEEDVDFIVNYADGDARRAINTLQTSVSGGEVVPEALESMSGGVDDELTREIVDLAVGGRLDKAMEKLDVEVLGQAVAPRTLADSFYRVIKKHDELPGDSKVKMLHKLAEKESRVQQGANANIQFGAFITDVNIARHLSLENYMTGDES